MWQMVVFVLTDPQRLDEVVEAWSDSDVPGITILDSTGIERLRDRCRRDDLPLFPSMNDVLENDEAPHRTLLAVVPDQQVDALIAATERVVGNLDEADSGVLFTVPVGRVRGLRQRR